MPGEADGDAPWVFGYGSLVDVDRLARFLGRSLREADDFVDCALIGWRRVWNVAMDNAPGDDGGEAKHYRSRTTGERPSSYVTFLNVEPGFGDAPPVNGVAFRVGRPDLLKLDARERRYDRIEVTAELDRRLAGPVYTYVGRRSAVERYLAGRRRGTSVVAREYLELVEQAFRRRGAAAWERFLRSTDPPAVPVADLVMCGGEGAGRLAEAREEIG